MVNWWVLGRKRNDVTGLKESVVDKSRVTEGICRKRYYNYVSPKSIVQVLSLTEAHLEPGRLIIDIM